MDSLRTFKFNKMVDYLVIVLLTVIWVALIRHLNREIEINNEFFRFSLTALGYFTMLIVTIMYTTVVYSIIREW
jgi:hypothetical protein